jgi:hypothetical protein
VNVIDPFLVIHRGAFLVLHRAALAALRVGGARIRGRARGALAGLGVVGAAGATGDRRHYQHQREEKS